jgi:hypothetical protein
MIISANARAALDSLRGAPEDHRAFGTAIAYNGSMCACAWLAKPLGITLHAGIETRELIKAIAARTAIHWTILAGVPALNDARDDEGPVYTFEQIADILTESVTLASDYTAGDTP